MYEKILLNYNCLLFKFLFALILKIGWCLFLKAKWRCWDRRIRTSENMGRVIL